MQNTIDNSNHKFIECKKKKNILVNKMSLLTIAKSSSLLAGRWLEKSSTNARSTNQLSLNSSVMGVSLFSPSSWDLRLSYDEIRVTPSRLPPVCVCVNFGPGDLSVIYITPLQNFYTPTVLILRGLLINKWHSLNF